MKPDDILFAPIRFEPWRDLCCEITSYIENNRQADRMLLPLLRHRPIGALLLIDFLESYHGGQAVFHRVSYPDLVPISFIFDGVVHPIDTTNSDLPSYPSYVEVGYPFFRSIEDANLVSNTYNHTYIFKDILVACDAIKYLIQHYP